MINKLDKIRKLSKKMNKNIFSYTIFTQEMILLFLKTEIILHSNKSKPNIEINKYLQKIIDRLKDILSMKNFQENTKIKFQNFNKEINHQKLFQDLWIRYNNKEFINDRFNYYVNRIKKNNILKDFKNKNCIDFGCGHGQFLMALKKLGAKNCVGIDFGEKNISFANKMRKKLKFNKNKVKFLKGNVYNVPFKKESFEFAIQNGVFHHLKNENRAYKEVYRVLKKGGKFWVFTDGKGGIRGNILDFIQEVLQKVDDRFILNVIRSLKLTANKTYMLSDFLNAKYRRTSRIEIIKRLKKIGFINFKPMQGTYKTDYDKFHSKDKNFKLKFGEGHIRFLCEKK
tara:strand:- start:423 stop:1445 length:1023 start_codon:yes stop_codon:yes gene_type:complete